MPSPRAQRPSLTSRSRPQSARSTASSQALGSSYGSYKNGSLGGGGSGGGGSVAGGGDVLDLELDPDLKAAWQRFLPRHGLAQYHSKGLHSYYKQTLPRATPRLSPRTQQRPTLYVLKSVR